MFRDLMVPSPRDLMELGSMPKFVHPDHLKVEAIRLEPSLGPILARQKDWQTWQLNIFKATRFLYLNGTDPAIDKQKIAEILRKVEYEGPSQGTRIRTLKIVGKNRREELVKLSLQKEHFEIEDSLGYSFWANCPNLSSMGASAILVKEDARSPYLPHLKTLMGLALSYFQRNGIWISQFEGEWEPGYFSATNYEVFRQLVNEGQSPEAAAFLTPTGKVLRRFGFDKVEVEDYEGVGVYPKYSRRVKSN